MSGRQIAFDTETTGLDPKAGHRVVEIGCVEMVDYIRTGKVFHAYINPERDMPAEAERVHGLSAAFLSDKPLFKDVAQKFVEFVADATLVAHNASFDMKFINHELAQLNYTIIPNAQVIDTLEIARRKYPGQPASLDALCKRFNVDLSAREKHGALLDAELLADVYLELMGGRQASFGLQAAGENAQQADSPALLAKVTSFTLRQFSVSVEELAAHDTFLQTHMKEPLWAKYKVS